MNTTTGRSIGGLNSSGEHRRTLGSAPYREREEAYRVGTARLPQNDFYLWWAMPTLLFLRSAQIDIFTPAVGAVRERPLPLYPSQTAW